MSDFHNSNAEDESQNDRLSDVDFLHGLIGHNEDVVAHIQSLTNENTTPISGESRPGTPVSLSDFPHPPGSN